MRGVQVASPLRTERSVQLFEEAQRYLPGGVNSPVRAFKAVGGPPLVIARGEGAYIEAVDGNRFIDYVGSWGPLCLGHAHPAVVAAVQAAAANGTSFGAPTVLETDLAKLVVDAFPAMEMVRFVSSGTEAVMSALRVARGYTGRPMIIKFDGCYHGHSDSLLVKAGSGPLTLGTPDSQGVPAGVTAQTLSLPFNDLGAVAEAFAEYPGQIAAVALEPVAGNMGVVPPAPGYLAGLRDLTRQHGALLVFDEVMTGFRVAYGGAQVLYDIEPDLTCLSKVVGGGLPAGAYGGRREIMQMVAPLGPVYQAGTLSGNPLAMTAGATTLQLLGQPGVFDGLEAASAQLGEGLAAAARDANVAVWSERVGSMMTTFFTSGPVSDYASAKPSATARYARFHRTRLETGRASFGERACKQGET
jgi:glutamate-1-semialdehyde 2,1-aminomutase